MEGEDRRLWRALLGYVSAQLQSRYVALETATRSGDEKLMHRAAQSYHCYASMTQQLHTTLVSVYEPTSTQSHGLIRISEFWLTRPHTRVVRHKRLPRVIGDEQEQYAAVREIGETISTQKPLVISYRQRNGELIMKLGGTDATPMLWYASRHNRLVTTVRHVSEEAILGFLLGEKLERAGLKLRERAGSYYVHFRVARQLNLPIALA